MEKERDVKTELDLQAIGRVVKELAMSARHVGRDVEEDVMEEEEDVGEFSLLVINRHTLVVVNRLCELEELINPGLWPYGDVCWMDWGGLSYVEVATLETVRGAADRLIVLFQVETLVPHRLRLIDLDEVLDRARKTVLGDYLDVDREDPPRDPPIDEVFLAITCADVADELGAVVDNFPAAQDAEGWYSAQELMKRLGIPSSDGKAVTTRLARHRDRTSKLPAADRDWREIERPGRDFRILYRDSAAIRELLNVDCV